MESCFQIEQDGVEFLLDPNGLICVNYKKILVIVISPIFEVFITTEAENICQHRL